jgi:hypothetical protein
MTAIVSGVSRAQNASDQCRDVLITAAHNINQNLKEANISTKAWQSLCAANSAAAKSNSSFGLGLSVPGVGSGSLDSNSGSASNVMANSCNNGTQQLDSSNLDIVLQNFVDHEAVAAWRDCIKVQNLGSGLWSTVERAGQDLVINIWWVDKIGVPSTKVNYSDISGVSGPCATTPWPPVGTVITTAGANYICKAAGLGQVAFVVSADHGKTSFKVPAYQQPSQQPPPPAPDPRSACLNGNVSGCKQAAADVLKTCLSGPPGISCRYEAQCLGDMELALEAGNNAAVNQMRSTKCKFPTGGKF